MSIAMNAPHTLSLAASRVAPQPDTRPMSSACMQSTDLLRGQKTVEIVHNGSTYRLQATRLGKLILTK